MKFFGVTFLLFLLICVAATMGRSLDPQLAVKHRDGSVACRGGRRGSRRGGNGNGNNNNNGGNDGGNGGAGSGGMESTDDAVTM